MTKTGTALDRIADVAIAELGAARPSDDAVGAGVAAAAAAVAAAALVAESAAKEASDRDRVIRIAKRQGATLRALAEATGLSRQTIAKICATSPPTRKRDRPASCAPR